MAYIHEYIEVGRIDMLKDNIKKNSSHELLDIRRQQGKKVCNKVLG